MKHLKTTNHHDEQDWHTWTNSPCQDSKLVQWGTWVLQWNNWVGFLAVAVRTQESGLVQDRPSVGLRTNRIVLLISYSHISTQGKIIDIVTLTGCMNIYPDEICNRVWLLTIYVSTFTKLKPLKCQRNLFKACVQLRSFTIVRDRLSKQLHFSLHKIPIYSTLLKNDTA